MSVKKPTYSLDELLKMQLLTTNAKLLKSEDHDKNIECRGLALAPHRRSGYNVCKKAGYCASVCNLWFNGRTVTKPVREAMVRRTIMMHEYPTWFQFKLTSELSNMQIRCQLEKRVGMVRLNLASDMDWSETAAMFPYLTFYDYTKYSSRIRDLIDGFWPKNYYLTASYHENEEDDFFRYVLSHRVNVAVVFDVPYRKRAPSGGLLPLPEAFLGVPVVDGDKHDIRLPEYDGYGVVVGLRYKGPKQLLGEAVKSGFVVKA